MKAMFVIAVLLAGCAGAQRQEQVRTVPLASLEQRIVAGQTTREQARALAEPAQRIAFASGYEAWLYHFPAGAAAGEFVVLFDPSGVVRKTRQRLPGNVAAGDRPPAY